MLMLVAGFSTRQQRASFKGAPPACAGYAQALRAARKGHIPFPTQRGTLCPAKNAERSVPRWANLFRSAGAGVSTTLQHLFP